MEQKIIFHIDVNSAFLSWSALRRLQNGDTLDLRTVPSIIGGDRKQRHGIVLAKSIPAKKYGIRTAEPIVSAFRKCPNLIMEKPDMEYYHEMSHALMDELRSFCPDIEQLSVDECFMDFTPIRNNYASPLAGANCIREHIKSKFGFTVNIGISDRRVLAKMASDFEKPDKVHTLFPEEMESKFWPLPVRDLFLVGAATEKKLKLLGIDTIGELAQADVNLLKRRLGKHGETIWHFANGRNADAVTPEPAENKGYGNSTTTAQNVVTSQQAYDVLLSLSETVAARMRRDGKCGSCISIHLRTNEFRHCSRQTTLHGATNLTTDIFQAACRLFDETWDRVTPLRQLGVQMTRLSSQPYQQYDFLSGITPQQYERKLRLDETVDALRDKFGEEIIRRGKFAQSPEKHMAGGLDKARRTGITKPVPEE